MGGVTVGGTDALACTAQTWVEGAGQIYQADATRGAILLCRACSPAVDCDADFVAAATGVACGVGVQPPSSATGLPSTFQGTLCRVPSSLGSAVWVAGQAPTEEVSGGCVTVSTTAPEPDFQLWCPPVGSFA
jgi:hypothetical protein